MDNETFDALRDYALEIIDAGDIEPTWDDVVDLICAAGHDEELAMRVADELRNMFVV